ncbi:hypothetical protein SOM11_14605 [Frigoribacterium sp. CFBP9039]|uniref:hypothetical protein n=1 Tax=Frigoribacterium TaxID=96492 RepID=UPI001782F965|nr:MULTISPECIES: hypothetical protein [Frigoribacterium]MBD8704863.1 hypothetical protein [Frigoribacterium sp. CFBP 13712]MCJ0701834.1 hypothetical protein [Frigoribacterium faeni]MDY0893263.1 hypothetical protein [Frigoribacterium sp. CFBP9030]MDY0947224.1 hypothetical protein [Frigoribacterium sp. CFBP9039]
MSIDAEKTVQLRRYELVEGVFDEFVEWFQARIVPAREAEGFAVEFAYADREAGEFVWAVSVAGDAATFAAVEEAYLASDSRAAAFADQPKRVAASHVRLIEPVVPAGARTAR